MNLFGKSASKKLKDLVDKFPDAKSEMSPDETRAYLEKGVLLKRKVDEALEEGKINQDLANELKKKIQKKGLSNKTLQFMVTGPGRFLLNKK